MDKCILCDIETTPFINKIEDYEYGVKWLSRLVRCPACGLITHDPRMTPDDIPSLYPDNYLAHSSYGETKGIYGYAKYYLAKRAAKKIVSRIPYGGIFLEVGCGNCQLISLLSEVRDDISFVGVDIERMPVDNIPRFTFHHGQLENTEIPSHSVDLIYCSNLIEHVPDPRLFLRKCISILKPGGVIYGITPDHLSFDRFIFRRYWGGYHYPRHTFIFDHKNLAILLQQEGFKDIKLIGGYSFWYISIANILITLPGLKKRGIIFALITAVFLPFDLLLNLFYCHGSMKFIGRSAE